MVAALIILFQAATAFVGIWALCRAYDAKCWDNTNPVPFRIIALVSFALLITSAITVIIMIGRSL